MHLVIWEREAITSFNQGLHQGQPQFLHSRQLYTQPRAKEILLFPSSQVPQRWPSTEEQWTALHGMRWCCRFRTQLSHSDLPQPTVDSSGEQEHQAPLHPCKHTSLNSDGHNLCKCLAHPLSQEVGHGTEVLYRIVNKSSLFTCPGACYPIQSCGWQKGSQSVRNLVGVISPPLIYMTLEAIIHCCWVKVSQWQYFIIL